MPHPVCGGSMRAPCEFTMTNPRSMHFCNHHVLQLCVLLFITISSYGCGPSAEPSAVADPTATSTWQPVPTFTPTDIPPALDAVVEIAPQRSVAPSGEISETTAAGKEAARSPSILVPTATPADEQIADNDETAILEATPSPNTEPLMVVAAEIVNVRLGPGIAYDLIASAQAGDEFPLIGRNEQGDWWQVCCFNGDQPGWLYGPLVDTYGAEEIAIALDIPPLPTAVPTVIEAEVEVAVTTIADAPTSPTVTPDPSTAEPSTPPTQSGTAGNFDPNAQFHIVHYRVIGYGENNGGIFNNGGQHIIFVNVIDENGQGIDGAVVKDALADDLHIVTGSKGPGRAEFEMFWEPYKLYVASIPAGPVTSQISNQMNTAKPHIPDIVGKLGPPEHEYAICPTPDDRCEPPFFHAHWSYEITFQQVK